MTKYKHKASATPPRKTVKKETLPGHAEVVEWVILGLILAFIAFIRIRLSSFPLERDEGEYAYFGQLILDGFPPYKLAYNLKFPGTYYCYAFSMAVFGQSIQGIRMGLLLFDLGTLVFLFLATKKLFNAFTGLIAVMTCGLLITGPSLLGQAAHATHFVTFFMMAGTWCLLLALEKEKWLWFLCSGLLMGLAFIMKQSGIFFSLFGGAVIIAARALHWKKNLKTSIAGLLLYILGVCIPVVLMLILMKTSSVFEKFWFWTITYPGEYGSRIPLAKAGSMFLSLFPMVTKTFTVFWILAGLGFLGLFIPGQKPWNRLFVILFLLASFLPAVPGFYFRNHYFVPLLPAIGMLTGIFFDSINRILETRFRPVRYLTAVAFIMVVITQLSARKDYLFTESPADLCRYTYRGNLFAESVEISRYIEDHSSPDEKIFVFGSEPQIYFYSHRRSATGYIYMYDLSFDQRYRKQMQNELETEVETNAPKYIIYCSSPSSWNISGGVTDTLFQWFNKYLTENKFIVVGYADYRFPGPTTYIWDAEALRYRPQSQIYMAVLRRSE